jgi:hypothetical protein
MKWNFVPLLALLFWTSSIFSQRIVLTGKAIVLEPVGHHYRFPDSYQRSAYDFHFVYIAGTYRVCHLNRQPILSHLDVLRVSIELYQRRFFWNCYAYDPRFFEIDY